MASSSARETGIGSDSSLITVQNSGSDGRSLAAVFRAGLLGAAGGSGMAVIGAARLGRSRTLRVIDLATAVHRRPVALAHLGL